MRSENGNESAAARSLLGVQGEFYELPFYDPNNEVLLRRKSKNLVGDNIKLYPNPTTGILNVDLGFEYGQATIIGYDMMGHQILSSPLISGNNILQINKPYSGIVIYNIFDTSGKIIKTGKLILIK